MNYKHRIERRLLLLLAVTALMSLLAACSPVGPQAGPDPTVAVPPVLETEPPAAEQTLEGTEWELTSLLGRAPRPGTRLTIEFDQAQMGGYAGCNHYGGAYELSPEGSLALDEIAYTARACLEPEGVMDQEQEFLEALKQAEALAVRQNQLEILGAGGQAIMIFNRQEAFDMDPAQLTNTRWQLQSFNQGTEPGNQMTEGAYITLAFEEDGKLRGYSGCRRFSGTYQASGDDFNLTMLSMDDLYCFEPETELQQEGDFTTALSETSNYRIVEDRLEMLTVGGGILIFEPLAESADMTGGKTIWVLDAFERDGQKTPTLDGFPLTISFSDEGQASGSAGCNDYSTSYSSDGSFITFEPPIATKKYCPDPASIMAHEQAYLETLPDVRNVLIQGEQMRMETGDGRALLFRPGSKTVNQ